MNGKIRVFVALLILLVSLLLASGCQSDTLDSLEIENDRITLEIGSTYQLKTNAPDSLTDSLVWTASGSSASVDQNGLVTAVEVGKTAVTVSYKDLSDTAIIEVVSDDPDSLDDFEREEFYGDYEPADSYEEALRRSQLGLISGSVTVPDQAPHISKYQPKKGNALVRNNEPYFADENTYVVVNAYGTEVFRIYRGGGYITLEEVAAYVYAFGTTPANYIPGKNSNPANSIWGEYLRLNNSKFSGNTSKYPYEPELPNISGCGGDLTYYEIDIGTTGTDCDPSYAITVYNNGQKITRGAARIVYTRFDKNGDKIIDPNEKYLFYTYNHYNDFQEYLNYYGGWGEMFGNITGGGKLSSKSDYKPTPYVPSVLASLKAENTMIVVYYYDPHKQLLFA